MLRHFVENLDIFNCPACKGDLTKGKESILCNRCRKEYPIQNGIPLFFCFNDRNALQKDVTSAVKSFYEKTPFPNYEDFESVGDLVEKARRGIFARLLEEQIPYNIRVLDVGCGTGQLSNFLSATSRVVFGTDMCFNSLKLAQDFKIRHSLERAGFYQMNLFRPIFKPESFPLVVCHGVLHHTSDPFGGFKAIGQLVKKGGYIIVGLYNKYGRMSTDIRRVLLKRSGFKGSFLDPYLQRKDIGENLKRTWFMDQYMHPHESEHTYGEVLKWFAATGFTFVNSIPKLSVFQPFLDDEKLFKVTPSGGRLNSFLVQMKLVCTGYKDGGFFLMIGKKGSGEQQHST